MNPRLIAITDAAGRGAAATLEMALAVCDARPGTVAVLLRDKQECARQRIEWGRSLREITAARRQHLIVADRADIALLVNADGVHLGESSVACDRVRRWLLPTRPLWVSRAWHDRGPRQDDADALLLAPVIAQRKANAALGVPGLARAVEAASGQPIYALGGIGAASVDAVMSSGCAGVAAIGAAYDEPNALLAALRIQL